MRISHLVLAAAAVASITPAFAEPFGQIHVAANRSMYKGRGCPIEVVYTATINFILPHPKGFVFNYHWERSDGAKGPSHVVRPGEHERTLVVHEKWKLGAPGNTYDASAVIHLNSGNEHIQEGSPSVHIECH
jgi:hypothetical protein